MRFTGWRKRMVQQLAHLDTLGEFLVTKEGEEEYATGIHDAVEYILLVLATIEKQHDYTFDDTGITAPAILARYEKHAKKSDKTVDFFVAEKKDS